MLLSRGFNVNEPNSDKKEYHLFLYNDNDDIQLLSCYFHDVWKIWISKEVENGCNDAWLTL